MYRVSSTSRIPLSISSPSKTGQPSTFEPIVAFYIILFARLIAALYSPIQDCDEVFNYWEPSHYLNHGYGLETWEYSPVYAIRSWTYAGIHSTIIALARLLFFVRSKSIEFYLLRVAFAIVCAICESRMYSTIARVLNPRIALIFLIITVTSTGMFHASVAYLPSSFAMYTTMLGTTAFMDWGGGLRTAQGVMWYGVGAILGWPFAGALVIPFVCEELILASVTQSGIETARRLVDGFTRSLIVLALQFFIDLFFYRRIAVVPWNIVRYNLFSTHGPNLYGTEPWDFYLRNLFLNFNLWTLLALLSLPLLVWQNFVRRLPATRQSFLRNATFLSPLYLWLLIFSAQPHKEERFMYPVYPLLALNAAIALHIVMTYLGSANPRALISLIPGRARMAAIVLFVIFTLDIAFLRTYGLISGYRAPLQVYAPLKQPGVARPGDNVCLGKEWYRFPSSYHLPNGARAKFIKSEFDGLLPGEFSEAKVGFGFFPGAWLEPPGMNDENKEDLGKYVRTTNPNHRHSANIMSDRSISNIVNSSWTRTYLPTKRRR